MATPEGADESVAAESLGPGVSPGASDEVSFGVAAPGAAVAPGTGVETAVTVTLVLTAGPEASASLLDGLRRVRSPSRCSLRLEEVDR